MKRLSGVFLHPTSLPSRYGVGDLGEFAYRWVDLLRKFGQGLWQICPLGPTGFGDSPYNCLSSFAGNPLLISPDKLFEDGLLSECDIKSYPELSRYSVDFEQVGREKGALLEKAFSRFKKNDSYDEFCNIEKEWLDDFAGFMVLRQNNGGRPWYEWERSLRCWHSKIVGEIKRKYAQEIEYYKFVQYVFDKQWRNIRRYAGENGVEILGDVPYYAAYDSADVWADQKTFGLDIDGIPESVGGVPPDYFSEIGQLWGNPIYNWDYLQKNDYGWWVKRIKRILSYVDWLRIDHFRGFEAYWSIPAGSENAITGKWVKGPGKKFFAHLKKELGTLPIVAEDLGVITKEVDKLRKGVKMPGMRVIQFAFDGDSNNPHRPHNVQSDSIVYTGTHDNDTLAGWLWHQTDEQKKMIYEYLGCKEENVFDTLLRTVCMSVANWCIIPFQDILHLDGYHRMNTPGTVGNNWNWRFVEDMIDHEKLAVFADYTKMYGRY